jgi:hypothetical protein
MILRPAIFMLIFLTYCSNALESGSGDDESLIDRPLVARRIFLESVRHRLGDLKIVQARLKRHQKRLLLQKILDAGKRSSKDAKVWECFWGRF